MSLRLSFRSLLIVLLLGVSLTARADRASGTWTGSVETRGNYYWERSTRVVAPTVGVNLESPDGVQLHADYLVDVITSASQAAGVVRDIRFTEVRHEVGASVGHEFDLGSTQLQAMARGRFSKEPDYTSGIGGLDLAWSLNQRATILRGGFTLIRDSVGRVLRGGNVSSSESDDKPLNGTLINIGIEQVISPTLIASFGYQAQFLSGFLSNRYRQVPSSDSPPLSESHPSDRIRHNAHARLAWYIPESGTAIHGMYRAYIDSWDIAALTPELRIYQEISQHFMIRARYRFYAQTQAFFVQETYSQDDTYVTADPKMTEFQAHEAGLQLRLHLFFLDESFLGFARDAWLDVGVDRIWRNNAFGNGVIAQGGLLLPF